MLSVFSRHVYKSGWKNPLTELLDYSKRLSQNIIVLSCTISCADKCFVVDAPLSEKHCSSSYEK